MLNKNSKTCLFLPGVALATYLMLAGFALAQTAEPVWPRLTPKLQNLLQKEMLSIHKASQEILTAMIEGDDARVAELAQQIHDSFILRKSMTPKDKADLVSAVLADFVKRDKEFHEISAELAKAARGKDRERQHKIFTRMIEACSACHARYATDRFPYFPE